MDFPATTICSEMPRRRRPGTYEQTLAHVRELSEQATLRPSPFRLEFTTAEPAPALVPHAASPGEDLI
jgi:hypothetical protein